MLNGLIGLSLGPDGSVVRKPWPFSAVSVFVREGREADLVFLLGAGKVRVKICKQSPREISWVYDCISSSRG